MPKDKQYYAYDLEYSHILREIKTPISIYSSCNSAEGKCVETYALWDTGATHSVFTPKIVQDLGLIAVDTKIVSGIDKEKSSDIVVATILLPNAMVLPGRRYSVNFIPGADVIIGMDIISMGDFVITNARGKTLFSFVIPTLNNKISFLQMSNDIEKETI